MAPATSVLPTTPTAAAGNTGPTVRTLMPLSQTPDMADCDLMQQYGFPDDETEPSIAVNQAQGGTISFAPRRGGGTVFRFSVPRGERPRV